MANILSIAKDAIAAVQFMDGTAKKVLPEEIASVVTMHAKIAVASAFIPVGGLDMAAATANVWTMYIRINSKLGLNFSQNTMKSIGSAVISNLAQNVGIMAIAAGLKWTGIGYLYSAGIMSGALYALTLTAGLIYLKSISLMTKNNNNLDKSVEEALQDKEIITEHLLKKVKK